MTNHDKYVCLKAVQTVLAVVATLDQDIQEGGPELYPARDQLVLAAGALGRVATGSEVPVELARLTVEGKSQISNSCGDSPLTKDQLQHLADL